MPVITPAQALCQWQQVSLDLEPKMHSFGAVTVWSGHAPVVVAADDGEYDQLALIDSHVLSSAQVWQHGGNRALQMQLGMTARSGWRNRPSRLDAEGIQVLASKIHAPNNKPLTAVPAVPDQGSSHSR